VTLSIYNETILVNGSLTFSQYLTVEAQLFTNDTLGSSGTFIIGGTVQLGRCTLSLEILYPAGVGSFSYLFASFPVQSPTIVQMGAFILPPTQRYCRRQPTGAELSFPGNAGLLISSELTGTVDGCGQVKNRTWVLAILIIAFIWACVLLCFALVTCKLSPSLKEKYWDSDYVRA